VREGFNAVRGLGHLVAKSGVPPALWINFIARSTTTQPKLIGSELTVVQPPTLSPWQPNHTLGCRGRLGSPAENPPGQNTIVRN